MGLPEGNVYEYMAMQVQKFEKKIIAERKKVELLEDYKNTLKKLDKPSVLVKKKSVRQSGGSGAKENLKKGSKQKI